MTDKIRVHHILDAISEIENYLSDVTYEIFKFIGKTIRYN